MIKEFTPYTQISRVSCGYSRNIDCLRIALITLLGFFALLIIEMKFSLIIWIVLIAFIILVIIFVFSKRIILYVDYNGQNAIVQDFQRVLWIM